MSFSMVNLVSLYHLRKHKSVSLFHTRFDLDLFFFLSSFSVFLFIKVFLIYKSKSSTNLNHKEEKQKDATIDKSTTISDSWEKYILYVIYPWDNFPGVGAVFVGAIM